MVSSARTAKEKAEEEEEEREKGRIFSLPFFGRRGKGGRVGKWRRRGGRKGANSAHVPC